MIYFSKKKKKKEKQKKMTFVFCSVAEECIVLKLDDDNGFMISHLREIPKSTYLVR
jgi:hypothetical protein